MTDEELEAAADDLAARRNDPRTPAIVRRAFLGERGSRVEGRGDESEGSARLPALTLRRYLALEEAASPVLDGRWPSGDPHAMTEAFCTAWATVFPGRSIPDAEGLQDAMAELQAAVRRSFSTVMPMRFPKVRGAEERAEAPDGLGWVARTVGRFVALGWRPDDVLDLPMDQLFILAAALAAHEGADCAGQDYREREGGEESGDRKACPPWRAETGEMGSAGGADGAQVVGEEHGVAGEGEAEAEGAEQGRAKHADQAGDVAGRDAENAEKGGVVAAYDQRRQAGDRDEEVAPHG